MTTRTQQAAARRWVLPFLAAFAAVLATILSAATASAATTATAETRVRASVASVEVLVEPPQREAAGQRLGNDAARPEIAVAAGVAANSGARFAQDVAVNPAAPRALSLTGRSVGRASHNAEIQKILSGLDGATDIRINQQQVNALGQRVGINRPDLQYTLGGRRYYVEIEGLANPRGAGHEARILSNDPLGAFDLRLVD